MVDYPNFLNKLSIRWNDSPSESLTGFLTSHQWVIKSKIVARVRNIDEQGYTERPDTLAEINDAALYVHTFILYLRLLDQYNRVCILEDRSIAVLQKISQTTSSTIQPPVQSIAIPHPPLNSSSQQVAPKKTIPKIDQTTFFKLYNTVEYNQIKALTNDSAEAIKNTYEEYVKPFLAGYKAANFSVEEALRDLIYTKEEEFIEFTYVPSFRKYCMQRKISLTKIRAFCESQNSIEIPTDIQASATPEVPSIVSPAEKVTVTVSAPVIPHNELLVNADKWLIKKMKKLEKTMSFKDAANSLEKALLSNDQTIPVTLQGKLTENEIKGLFKKLKNTQSSTE